MHVAPDVSHNHTLMVTLLLFESFGIEVNQTAAALFRRVMRGDVPLATKIKRLKKEIGQTSWEIGLEEVKGYRSPKTNTNQLFTKKLLELADSNTKLKKPAVFELVVAYSRNGPIYE